MRLKEFLLARSEDERVRYLFIGGINTGFGFIVFTGMYLALQNLMNYILIFLISQFLAVLFSHFTQRRYVWRSKNVYRIELAKFATSYTFVSLINLALLALAVDVLHLPVLISQYLIGFALVLGNYFSQKHWVFRR